MRATIKTDSKVYQTKNHNLRYLKWVIGVGYTVPIRVIFRIFIKWKYIVVTKTISIRVKPFKGTQRNASALSPTPSKSYVAFRSIVRHTSILSPQPSESESSHSLALWGNASELFSNSSMSVSFHSLLSRGNASLLSPYVSLSESDQSFESIRGNLSLLHQRRQHLNRSIHHGLKEKHRHGHHNHLHQNLHSPAE